MTADESLRRFGLVPSDSALPEIRTILQVEADKEAQGRGTDRETDLALLSCVQLFARALPEDILRIWKAKDSGFDLFCHLDIQLVCGGGLEETRKYLRQSSDPDAPKALMYIEECEASGDFEGFSPTKHLDHFRQYFRVTQ